MKGKQLLGLLTYTSLLPPLFLHLTYKTKTDDLSRLLYQPSGYRDSNPGPPTPEAGALTGLRYIPSYTVFSKSCRDTRIRTWDPLLPKQVR